MAGEPDRVSLSDAPDSDDEAPHLGVRLGKRSSTDADELRRLRQRVESKYKQLLKVSKLALDAVPDAATTRCNMPAILLVPARMRLGGVAFRLLARTTRRGSLPEIVTLLFEALAEGDDDAARWVFGGVLRHPELGEHDVNVRKLVPSQRLEMQTLLTAERIDEPRLLGWLLCNDADDGPLAPSRRWDDAAYQSALVTRMVRQTALPEWAHPRGPKEIDELNDGTRACDIPRVSETTLRLIDYGAHTGHFVEPFAPASQARGADAVFGSQESRHKHFGSAFVVDLVRWGCEAAPIFRIIGALEASGRAAGEHDFLLDDAIRAYEAASYNARRRPEWAYHALSDRLHLHLFVARRNELLNTPGVVEAGGTRRARIAWSNNDPYARRVSRLLGAPLLRMRSVSTRAVTAEQGPDCEASALPRALDDMLHTFATVDALDWDVLVPLLEEAHHLFLPRVVVRVCEAMQHLDRRGARPRSAWLLHVNTRERSFLTRAVQRADDDEGFEAVLGLPWGQEPLKQALCMAITVGERAVAARLLERIESPLPAKAIGVMKADFEGADSNDEDDDALPAARTEHDLLVFAAGRHPAFAAQLLAHEPSVWTAEQKAALLRACVQINCVDPWMRPDDDRLEYVAFIEDLLLPPHSLPIDCLDDEDEDIQKELRGLAANLYAPPDGRGYRIGLASWVASTGAEEAPEASA